MELVTCRLDVSKGIAMPFREAYRFEQSITHDLSQTEGARQAQTDFVEKKGGRDGE